MKNKSTGRVAVIGGVVSTVLAAHRATLVQTAAAVVVSFGLYTLVKKVLKK